MAENLGAGVKQIESHTQPTASWEPHSRPRPSVLDESDFVTVTEDRDLRRGLHQRHLSLIAIAGAIVSLAALYLLYERLIRLKGTGLFLGLGGSIQTAGPLGALLAYATIGLVVCAVQFALGEVTALLPVTGSFVRHAELLVDPAFGFAIG